MAMKNEWSEARRSTYILYMHLQYVRGLEVVALLFVYRPKPTVVCYCLCFVSYV